MKDILIKLFSNKNLISYMKSCVIAIDLGATSGRIILSYLQNDSLEMKEIARFQNNIANRNNKFFWDIKYLFTEIVKGLNIAIRQDCKILSVGIDTWGVDMGFIDKNGNIIEDPRSYRDPYTEGIMEDYFKIIPKSEVYEKTGIQFMNFNSLFQLYAAKKENFEPLNNAESILFIPDLISYLLTGNKVCEYTIASTSQFINPYNKVIDKDLLNAAGINPQLFPEIIMPGKIIGNIRKELLDITLDYDIPVIAVAGHDTASAVAAVPAVNENFAYLSSGTWSLMGIETKSPIINERSAELNFTNEGGIEGTTRFLKNITGMWILEQCRKEWSEQGKDYSYPQIVDMIEKATPFKSIINSDDPVFANPKSMISAIKEYCDKRDMEVPESDAEIVRCIMDSLALRYRNVMESLNEFAPNPIERLHIIGGGAKNDLLNQFTANSTGIPVLAGPSEATAIGNIMIQYKAAGEFKDITEMRKIISKTVDIKEYIPEDSINWDNAYKKFCKECI